jgi:hypothetical protein
MWSIFLCARGASRKKQFRPNERRERKMPLSEGRKGVQHTHQHCWNGTFTGGRVEIRFPNLTFSRLQNYGGPEKIIIAAADEFNSQMPNDLILHPFVSICHFQLARVGMSDLERRRPKKIMVSGPSHRPNRLGEHCYCHQGIKRGSI